MKNKNEIIVPIFDGDIKGIAIDLYECKNKVGKLKKINYANFKYVEGKKIKNTDDNTEKQVAFIEITNLPDNLVKEISTTINGIIDNKNISVEEAIDEVIDYFKKFKLSKEYSNELFGDIGEAIFILKCLQNKIDMTKFLRNIDNDLYDFYVKNQAIEVKTSSPDKNEFIITNEQLTQILDKKIIICKFKKIRGCMTILDIYDEIQKYSTLNNLLLEKKQKWINFQDELLLTNEPNYLLDYTVDLENCKIGMLKPDKIPEIKIIKMNACKQIKFHINCTDSELENFDEFLKWLNLCIA